MISLTLGKRGYSQKGVPIFYILKIETENQTDRELLKFFTDNSYIKRTWREPYPKLRHNLEDVYNKEINEFKVDGSKHKVVIHGFTFWVELQDLIEC